MKNTYPKYKTVELMLIKSKLAKKDKDILNKFLIFCGGTAGEKKLRNIEVKMLQIRDVSNISYSDWDLEKLREFLSVLNRSEISKATKNEIKKTFKRFLKEYYDDWSKKFKGLTDIKGENDMNHERLNANTILASEELEKIIRKAESLRYKALITLMFESGGRPEEILKLKWKDINLDKKEVKLSSSKNKTVRINPIKESIIHLMRYKQEFPFPDVQSNDFLFPSSTERKKHLSVSYFGMRFRILARKAIGRDIFPYILRHTRATQLQKVLPPKIYEKFMDHSIETATRYSHLDKDDVREVLLEKVYHVEELTEEEKEEIKNLKKELSKLKTDNIQIFKLLKKQSSINQIMLKAATKDKKTESYFKKQLNEILPKGEALKEMRVDSI